MLASLTSYTLTILSFAETGVNKLDGNYSFICKAIHSNASLKATEKSLLQARDFVGSGQSPTLPVCMCFMDIFSRNLGCCFRHLS